MSKMHLSQDYKALYELLCRGEDAIGWRYVGDIRGVVHLRSYATSQDGRLLDTGTRLMHSWNKDSFLRECASLRLEWVSSEEREIPTPKVFLTKFNGRINVAFRIDNQTFTLNMIRDEEMPEKEQTNWLANMLRSAFRQERASPENDPLLSMFNDNEPQEP